MEKFEELSQEKQRRIIDAGMEVFGRNEYKKANTEDIAAKAGISKGLLFYYFKDKKSFYILKCEQNCISSFEPGEENSRICYETMTDTAKGEAYTLYEIEIP